MSGITLNAVDALLGLGDGTAYRLHRLGHLRGRRVRRGGYCYLTYAALRRFVTSPLCWLYVAGGEIPDPELRAVALDARRSTPGRWWSTAEVAAACHVHPSRVRVWRRQGWQAGRWAATGRTAGGYHLWLTAPPVAPTAAPLRVGSIAAKRRAVAAD